MAFRAMHDDKGDYTYWKLNSYERMPTRTVFRTLKIQNYGRLTLKMPRAELMDVLNRYHRKLIDYHKLDNGELAALVKQLGMKISVGFTYPVPTTKWQLSLRAACIKALQATDDARTFHPFSRLPAELRVMIYTEHFGDMDTTLVAPATPPIARVSRAVRDEALQVFYFLHTMEISFFRQRSAGAAGVESRLFQMGSETRLFLAGVRAADFAHMRNVLVKIRDENNGLLLFECLVSLSRDGQRHTVRCLVDIWARFELWVVEQEKLEGQQRRIAEEIGRVLDAVPVTAGGTRKQLLSADIIRSFKGAIEAVGL